MFKKLLFTAAAITLISPAALAYHHKGHGEKAKNVVSGNGC